MKRYAELTVGQVGNSELYSGIGGGAGMNAGSYTLGQDANGVGYASNGTTTGFLFFNGGNAGSMPVYVNGAVLCFALDDVALLFWARNGASGLWNNSGGADPATGTGGITLVGGGPYFIAGTNFGNVVDDVSVVTMNAGASSFTGAAPSGFSPWDTSGQTQWDPGFNSFSEMVYSNGNLTATCTPNGPLTWRSGTFVPGRRPTSVKWIPS